MASLTLGYSVPGDSWGINSSTATIIALAALSASVVTGNQQETVAAHVDIIATDRKSLAHDLSSVIDIERFS